MFVGPQDVRISSLGSMPNNSLAVLNRSKDIALILGDNDKKYAIFLSAMSISTFDAFECTGNKHWNGFFIPDIEIEIDISSVSFEYAYKLGCINSSDGAMELLVKIQRDGISDGHSIPISKGGEVTNTEVNFSKWRLIRRIGKEIVALATVEDGVVDLAPLSPLGQ